MPHFTITKLGLRIENAGNRVKCRIEKKSIPNSEIINSTGKFLIYRLRKRIYVV
jgi:hypothetical protein